MARKLSEHFTLEEMVHSQTAARKGIDNTPSAEVVKNLRKTAELLEQVRRLLGDAPILVSSGYRSEELNKAVGGSKKSAHIQGLAADFTAPQVGKPFDVARKIAASDIAYDQLIYEYETWVHIGFAAASPRRQNLSIFTGTAFLPGILRKPPV